MSHCGGVGGVQVGVVEHPGGGWFCAWSPADPGLVFRGESLTEAFYGRVIAYNDMVFMGMCTLVSFMIGALFEWGTPLWAITSGLGLLFIFFGFYWKWVQKVIK